MAEGTMTKIKICGITNLDDAIMVTELGAEAIGFIFTPLKRKINPNKAREIIKELPPFLTTVGVFMDEALKKVNQIADYTGIDVVQLHGSESALYCNKIKRKVIKRISVNNNDTTRELISRMEKYKVPAYILDPGAGSGNVFNWDLATGIDLPLIIAGGLTPENVKNVILLLEPYGVDVVSGVEQSPGKKDKQKVKRFIEEVRSC